MMARGTCGPLRFRDAQSPVVWCGAQCGAAATRVVGSTGGTSSHAGGNGDKPASTHCARTGCNSCARWWSVTTSNFLSLCRPISPPTSPQRRAVFQAGRILWKGSDCMRQLLVGALIASLMGCCRTPPQAALERCTTKGCVQRTGDNSQTEIRRVAFKPSPAPANIKSAPVTPATAATAPVPPSTESTDQTGLIGKSATPVISSAPDAPVPSQSAETPDAVVNKAKATTAAILTDPESAEFDDMKRAIRKDM